MGMLAAMSRRRRCFYGLRWLEAAENAASMGKTVFFASRSPSRSESYVWGATAAWCPFLDLRLIRRADRALRDHSTRRCICVAATASRISESATAFLHWLKGNRGYMLPETRLLDTRVVYVDNSGGGS
jgi:hypothetical protein